MKTRVTIEYADGGVAIFTGTVENPIDPIIMTLESPNAQAIAALIPKEPEVIVEEKPVNRGKTSAEIESESKNETTDAQKSDAQGSL